MNYIKTNPTITYQEFYNLANQINTFKSLTGKGYIVQSITADVTKFIRFSTEEEWAMKLKGVNNAYIKLTDFKTANFKHYVPRTHSPALGLWLHLKLLIK